MIAVSGSGKSFRSLASYLATGRSGEEQDRVAWTTGRNLPTEEPELAATFMRATAAQSDRIEKPVYHIVVSFDPSDPVEQGMMERVADRLLERLGLAEHQAVIVAHRDRDHAHLHIMVNRVHPETGKAWERWKDQPVIQQVLREEERALGLREVTGTLSPQREPETPERTAPAPSIDNRSVEPADERHTDRESPSHQSTTPPTRVDEVAQSLETRQRVVELTREQYHAQLDASAARSRVSQLEAAAERERDAVAAFDRSLKKVYRDPEQAHRAYFALVEEKGLSAAMRRMREDPEQLGALVTVEHSRAFGLVRGEDDTQARAAAPLAAGRGREAIEAVRDFGKVAAETQARRFDAAFTRELRAIYQEPAVARTAFERLVAERGIEHAAAALRKNASELGALRSSDRRGLGGGETHVARAAELGMETTKPRAFAKSAGVPDPGTRLENEPAASRVEAERAVARESAIRDEIRGLPGRGDLERRISNLLDRMSSREVRQLGRIVSAPRLALAMEIRTAIRDVALGRDNER